MKTAILPVAQSGAQPGDLLLIFGNVRAKDGRVQWQSRSVDERVVHYFLSAPDPDSTTRTRLSYAGKHLEHRSVDIATDAYREFALAPFEDVASVVNQIPVDNLITWLASSDVPDGRKGLYGLMIGISARDTQSLSLVALLKSTIEKPADDYRAGFDGVLGGLLVAIGPDGLAFLETKLLKNDAAKDGDLRHLVRALRAYWQFGENIPRDHLRKAMREFLGRPPFAREAIIDLARWEDWSAVELVSDLYSKPDYQDAPTQRAIIGFMLRCPGKLAALKLAKIEKLDPKRVSEARRLLPLTGGAR